MAEKSVEISNVTTDMMLFDENNKPKLKENGELQYATFGDLLTLVVNQIPERGHSILDIRNRLEIIEAIDKARDTIRVNKNHLAVLKSDFNSYRWLKVNQFIVQLEEHLNSL